MSAFRVMVPVAQLGFAAGKAARQCLETGQNLSNVDVPALQAAIQAGGQNLDLSAYGRYLRHQLFARENVFEGPQSFARCHAATTAQVSNARFLVAWFGGEGEGSADSAIWISERAGRQWSTPRRVAKVSDEPHWNPVLFRAPNHSLRLFFKTGPRPQAWRTWVMTSKDEGRTWSEAVPVGGPEQPPFGPVKNKPIVLQDGTWLAPNSVETADGRWDALVDRSTDDGATWTHSAFVPIDRKATPSGGVIQPALWESEPGHVHMLLRSTAGFVFRSDSQDGGKTWSEARATDLPGANSGLDVARLDDGMLALVFNPSDSDQRTPLTIALSSDNGATWPHRLDIETGEGEFSYPAIIPTRTGMAIAYTWKREHIAFWHGSIERIISPSGE